MENLKFYIVNVGGFVDVVDYVTYETIKLLDLNKSEDIEEARKFLVDISKMNNYAYIDMLMKITKSKSTKDLLKERDKDREDWIKGAWLQVTNCTLKGLKLDINYHYNKDFEKACEEYNTIISKRKTEESLNKLLKPKKKALKPNKSNKSKKDIKPLTEENNSIKKAIKPKQIEKTKPLRKEEESKPLHLKKKIKKKMKTR